MDKKILLSIVLTVCFTVFQLTAKESSCYEVKSIKQGSQIYGKETVEKIETNGLIKLDGTTITEYLQVNGSLKAEGAQIEKMQINGQATLDNCLIKKKSVVCGFLSVINSKFRDELSVSSEKATFNSSTLTSLHILQVEGYQGVQLVELVGKTKIDGSITFDSGKGEVIADPDTEITGKIIGGKIRN